VDDTQLEHGFEEDLLVIYNEAVEKAKKELALQQENYINGLWRQSEEDLYAAEVLQHYNCYAQAIFWYQQASDKALKALLLKRGLDLGVKSHDLVLLAETALTKQEQTADNLEGVKNTRLIEAIGPKEQRKRSLFVRARYAAANMSTDNNTQPWFVFHSKDVLNASEYTTKILIYCTQELGFEKIYISLKLHYSMICK
jgi:HEPN domain-containing protein